MSKAYILIAFVYLVFAYGQVTLCDDDEGKKKSWLNDSLLDHVHLSIKDNEKTVFPLQNIEVILNVKNTSTEEICWMTNRSATPCQYVEPKEYHRHTPVLSSRGKQFSRQIFESWIPQTICKDETVLFSLKNLQLFFDLSVDGEYAFAIHYPEGNVRIRAKDFLLIKVDSSKMKEKFFSSRRQKKEFPRMENLSLSVFTDEEIY